MAILWELAVRYDKSDGQALPDQGGWLDQDEGLMDAVLDVVARIRWHEKQMKARGGKSKPAPKFEDVFGQES